MGYGNYGIWERLYAQFCKSGSPKSYGLWEIMGYRSYGLSEIHLYYIRKRARASEAPQNPCSIRPSAHVVRGRS